jgi:uncharacterized protein
MKLPGLVTNITAFGAFVDIGVHQDGLVHVSQLSDRFVADPNKVVKVQQRVKVSVLSVDLERKRISLSMKKDAEKKKGGGTEGEKRHSEKIPAKKKGGKEPFNNPFVRAFGKEE